MAGQTTLARHFPFKIGRSTNADLRSEEPGMWDQHCQIEYRKGEGFDVRPLDRGAGIRVGDEAISELATLKNGDVLTLGSVQIAFAFADPVVGTFRLRAGLTWLTLVALVALQVYLIWLLPS